MVAKLVFFSAFLALTAASAVAGVVTDVVVDPGTESAVPFINKFSVSNFDMTGLKVTAYFDDDVDFTETGIWSGNQASSFNFRLSEVGDTFYSAWTLVNQSSTALLTKLVIEGTPGFTVFDLQGPTFRTTAGSVLPSGNTNAAEGTSDSERGYTFQWESINRNLPYFQNGPNPDSGQPPYQQLDVTATYSDIVRLTSALGPVGDIWTTLTIDFGGAAGGLIGPDFFGDSRPFVFFADTDTWGDRTTSTNDPVPEPSSLCLFAGLGMIGAWRYRRARGRSCR